MSTSPSSEIARITANDIPDDIWRLVAEELLQSMNRIRLPSVYMSVNRTFFHYFLDQKYGKIEWVQLDQKMISVLHRLQEPVIAQHVRQLSIRAWFIQYLLKREELFRGKPSTISQFLSLFSKEKSRAPAHRPLGSLQNNPPTKQGKLVDTISSKDVIHSMMTAVQNMTKVTTFNFEWRDLPLNKDTMSFLFNAREAFHKSLRSLVLRADFSKFQEILAITNFENVFEIDFTFDYSPDPDSDTINNPSNSSIAAKVGKSNDTHLTYSQMRWNETIVPFIEYRKSMLRSLTLSSECQYLDLSDLFDTLPHISSLRGFELHIPISTSFLSRPPSVMNFLKQHPSLNSISLLPVVSPSTSTPGNICNSVTGDLNKHLLKEVAALAQLYSLQIPFVSKDDTFPLLGRSADTLESLTLVGCPVAHEEVAALAGIFSPRPYGITHLRMNVRSVDLGLFATLATGFPGLRSLVLIGMDDDWDHRPSYANLELRATNERHVALLMGWGLEEISVYHKVYNPPSAGCSSTSATEEWACMLWISSYLPLLYRLKGSSINRKKRDGGADHDIHCQNCCSSQMAVMREPDGRLLCRICSILTHGTTWPE